MRSQKRQVVVLMVEDNDACVTLYKNLLADDASLLMSARTDSWYTYITQSVSTLGEAHALLSNHVVDLILLDLKLPNGIGVEAVRKLRKLVGPIPAIVVITGLEDSVLEKQAFAMLADEFLTKGQGMPAEQIVRSIRNAVARSLARYETKDSGIQQAQEQLEKWGSDKRLPPNEGTE